MMWTTALVASGLLTAGAGDSCYLFSFFRNNGEDGLFLAASDDGYTWRELPGGPFLRPTVDGKLMRDPCLALGPDGVFRLVWTTGWGGRMIGYASSRDLKSWSAPKPVAVMAAEPGARNCWAPEVIWNAAAGHWVVYWSTTIPGRFPDTDRTGDDGYNHRIYAATTTDFEHFTPTRLFFDGGFNVIDATMVAVGGQYRLIVKDETLKPVRKNLRTALGDSPDGPWREVSEAFTPSWVEGPTAIRIGDDYLIYFDCYTAGHYGLMRTRDWRRFEDVTARLSFPAGARHGTVLAVPKAVVDRLAGR
jgi:hypothetical protein